MRNNFNLLFVLCLFVFASCKQEVDYTIHQGQKIVLSFSGPETSESDAVNPFLDYRLDVTFQNGSEIITIPGYYAADGNAAESGAEAGNQWQVIFRPEATGAWEYEAKLHKGKDIALASMPSGANLVEVTKSKGLINVKEDKNYKGRLQYVNSHYLQYSQSKDYFIKGGCGSPENILGYYEIDGTLKGEVPKARKGEATGSSELHKFPNHKKDWKQGDPSWQNGKGKALIGALNYLASKGINSLYFLTMNIDGDGKDVFPYSTYAERERFDVSKLEQWEIVFDHMDKLGILMQVVLQETENELLLDDGHTGRLRKLYLREMIARYAHHTQLVWNMGEENGPVFWRPIGQSTQMQKDMTSYVKQTDPYKNCTTIHSHADKKTRDSLFYLLTGFDDLDGMSMQVDDNATVHESTIQWLAESSKAGKPWIISMDEVGPYWRGVDPDDRVDNNQDTIRAEALWGNLMAGGSGAEWYFGSKNHNNDLTCEDWRTRDRMWTYTANATSFFTKYIPFHEMKSADNLAKGADSYVFAKKGDTYLVYLMFGGKIKLDLSGETGSFKAQWYNPRDGGALQTGSIKTIAAGSIVDLGNPPTDIDNGKDWAILLTR